MIARLIRWSIANRFSGALLATVIIAAWGVWSISKTRWMPFPDLSGRAGHHPHHLSGQAPQIVGEPDHLSAHHHHVVGAGGEDGARLFFFGDSFVYILFDDGTDFVGQWWC